MPDHIGQVEQQRLHQFQVIGGPDDELAAAPAVLLPAVPAHQRRKRVHAEVMLHQMGDSTAVMPAHEGHEVDRNRSSNQHQSPRRQRSVIRRDRIVYDAFGDQRNHDRDRGADRRREQSQQQVTPVPENVSGQPSPPVRPHPANSPFPRTRTTASPNALVAAAGILPRCPDHLHICEICPGPPPGTSELGLAS